MNSASANSEAHADDAVATLKAETGTAGVAKHTTSGRPAFHDGQVAVANSLTGPHTR